ncbi:MAG: hypothetical protein ACJA08_002352, partial [Cyclobacteriaceae bacterium]
VCTKGIKANRKMILGKSESVKLKATPYALSKS